MFKVLEIQNKFIEDINNGSFLPEYSQSKQKNTKQYDNRNLEIYSFRNKKSFLPRETFMPSRDLMAEEFNNANYMFSMNYDQNYGISSKTNKSKIDKIKKGLFGNNKALINKTLTNLTNYSKTTNLDKPPNSSSIANFDNEILQEINDSLNFQEELKKFTKSSINFLVNLIFIH